MTGMLANIRKRVSYVNVVATLVLLFAMTGGALAAKKYLITSTKQISPKVLAELKKNAKGSNGAPGAQGPQGPAGPAGTPGAKGNDGANGTNGNNGANGSNGGTGPKGATGAAGATGPTGQTGFTETLPTGKTETGVWSATQGNLVVKTQPIWIPISFPIPLPAESTNAFFFNQEETEEENFGASGCTGTLFKPSAPPGTLCVYTGPEGRDKVEVLGVSQIFGGKGYRASGAILEFRTENTVSAEQPGNLEMSGTWAMTAP